MYKMKESCSSNIIYMSFKQETGVNDHTKVIM